jgi:hypothetical protein
MQQWAVVEELHCVKFIGCRTITIDTSVYPKLLLDTEMSNALQIFPEGQSIEVTHVYFADDSLIFRLKGRNGDPQYPQQVVFMFLFIKSGHVTAHDATMMNTCQELNRNFRNAAITVYSFSFYGCIYPELKNNSRIEGTYFDRIRATRTRKEPRNFKTIEYRLFNQWLPICKIGPTSLDLLKVSFPIEMALIDDAEYLFVHVNQSGKVPMIFVIEEGIISSNHVVLTGSFIFKSTSATAFQLVQESFTFYIGVSDLFIYSMTDTYYGQNPLPNELWHIVTGRDALLIDITGFLSDDIMMNERNRLVLALQKALQE